MSRDILRQICPVDVCKHLETDTLNVAVILLLDVCKVSRDQQLQVSCFWFIHLNAPKTSHLQLLITY